MSYWSHHPEEYDQLCRRAIAEKLVHSNKWYRFTEEEVESYLENMLDSCEGREIAYKIYDVLCDWASKETSEKEREYFNDLVP